MLCLHWMRICTAPLICAVALLAFGGETAYAQSDPIIQTVRTFSPVLSGTTDVVIDPAATYLDVIVTFTDVNPDPLGSKPITAFGFKENGMPPGWTFNSTLATPPTTPAGGNFSTGWFYINTPPLPFSFTYRLDSLSALTDLYEFSGATYYSTDGSGLSSTFDDTQTISPYPTFTVKRSVSSGLCLPQNATSLSVQLTLKAIGDMGPATELELTEVVPTGWLVDTASVSGADVPDFIQINASGNLEVSYFSMPTFPASFSYQIDIPALESRNINSFTTFAQYRLGAGEFLTGPISSTNLLIDSAPTLIYNGHGVVTIQCGIRALFTSYWSASDLEDGNLSSKIIFDTSAIDFNLPGSYPLTVSVSDSCGNTTSDTRTVKILDFRAPVITLNCTDATINCSSSCATDVIDCGTNYVDPGATAMDSCDGNLTSTMTVISTVPNPATPGRWTVTYTATDSSGYIGRVVRFVKVLNNCIGEGEGGAEGETCVYVAPDPSIHSADRNSDNVIGLSEFLRVVQLYNFSVFYCDCMTEDGFAACFGDETCTPHSSDYYPQNWKLSLIELLRAIQIFNVGAYYYCPGVGEDDFCPGTP